MGKIKLTPAELLSQSREMTGLQAEYQALFQKSGTALGQVNNSWSENLAHNFSGKISSAERGFGRIADMLGQGGQAAAESANTFEAMDTLLARIMTSGTGSGAPKASALAAAASQETSEDAERSFWKSWSDVAKIMQYYNNLSDEEKEVFGKIVGGRMKSGIDALADITTGNMDWDTTKGILNQIFAAEPLIGGAILGAFDMFFSEQYTELGLYYNREIFGEYDKGHILAGTWDVIGAFSTYIFDGTADVFVDTGIGLIEGLPFVGLFEEYTGFKLSEKWDAYYAKELENTKQGIKAVAEEIGNFEDKVDEFADKAKKKAGEFANKAKKEAGEFAAETARRAQNAVDEAKKAAVKAGNQIKEWGDSAGDAIRSFWK